MIINPGSGPVANAVESEALKNIVVLVEDAGAITFERVAKLDGEGRFGFRVLSADGAVHEVEMPGIPIERVRFTGALEQNIWHFPRLYIDGSSWVWKYAVNCLRPEEEEAK